MDDLRQAIFNAIDTYDLTKDRGALQEELFAALQARAEAAEANARRYLWWRENADAIANDGDGVIGVAYSYQINILDRDYTTAELMDMIADTAIDALGGGEG